MRDMRVPDERPGLAVSAESPRESLKFGRDPEPEIHYVEQKNGPPTERETEYLRGLLWARVVSKPPPSRV